jgi:hypothetical protein
MVGAAIVVPIAALPISRNFRRDVPCVAPPPSGLPFPAMTFSL